MLYDYKKDVQSGDYNSKFQKRNNTNNKSHIITFQKKYAVTLQFTEGEILEINDWIIEKCNSTQQVEYQKQNLPKNIINMAELESKTRVITRDLANDTTFLEVQPKKKVNLYLEFQADDKMYLNNWLSRALFGLLSTSDDPLSSTKIMELIEQGVITYSCIEYHEPSKVMVKFNK